MGLEPYIIEMVYRDRQRQVEAEVRRQLAIELERAAAGKGRGAWRPRRDQVRGMALAARVRMSELLVAGRRLRPR